MRIICKLIVSCCPIFGKQKKALVVSSVERKCNNNHKQKNLVAPRLKVLPAEARLAARKQPETVGMKSERDQSSIKALQEASRSRPSSTRPSPGRLWNLRPRVTPLVWISVTTQWKSLSPTRWWNLSVVERADTAVSTPPPPLPPPSGLHGFLLLQLSTSAPPPPTQLVMRTVIDHRSDVMIVLRGRLHNAFKGHRH